MEVIGLIASVIQIADATARLKALWSDVRHAPKDILDLVQEVSLNADLIADIQHQHRPEDLIGTDIASWTKCFNLFKACAQSLQDLVTELQSTMKAHRRTGALRVFSRSQDIQRCKERLQRVQLMMLSAQQAYAT